MKGEIDRWIPVARNVILGEKVRRSLLWFLFMSHFMSMIGFLLGFIGLSGETEIKKWIKDQEVDALGKKLFKDSETSVKL